MNTGFVTKGCMSNCIPGNRTNGDIVYCCKSYKCNNSIISTYSSIILFGQFIFLSV